MADELDAWLDQRKGAASSEGDGGDDLDAWLDTRKVPSVDVAPEVSGLIPESPVLGGAVRRNLEDLQAKDDEATMSRAYDILNEQGLGGPFTPKNVNGQTLRPEKPLDLDTARRIVEGEQELRRRDVAREDKYRWILNVSQIGGSPMAGLTGYNWADVSSEDAGVSEAAARAREAGGLPQMITEGVGGAVGALGNPLTRLGPLGMATHMAATEHEGNRLEAFGRGLVMAGIAMPGERLLQRGLEGVLRGAPEVVQNVARGVTGGALTGGVAGTVGSLVSTLDKPIDPRQLASDIAINSIMGGMGGRGRNAAHEARWEALVPEVRRQMAERAKGVTPEEIIAAALKSRETGMVLPDHVVTAVKSAHVERGGRLEEVVTPARVLEGVAAAEDATAAGLTPEEAVGAANVAVDALPAADGPGGREEGYRSTQDVRNDSSLPKAQLDAVLEAERQGVVTVSSGVDDAGVGYAIGVQPETGMPRRVTSVPEEPGKVAKDEPTMESRLSASEMAQERGWKTPEEALSDLIDDRSHGDEYLAESAQRVYDEMFPEGGRESGRVVSERGLNRNMEGVGGRDATLEDYLARVLDTRGRIDAEANVEPGSPARPTHSEPAAQNVGTEAPPADVSRQEPAVSSLSPEQVRSEWELAGVERAMAARRGEDTAKWDARLSELEAALPKVPSGAEGKPTQPPATPNGKPTADDVPAAGKTAAAEKPPKRRSPPKTDPTRDRLATFVRKLGGLRLSDAEGMRGELERLKHLSVLRNKKGVTLERALEEARNAGYLPEDATLSDLLDAVEGDIAGRAVYSDRRVIGDREAEAMATPPDPMEQARNTPFVTYRGYPWRVIDSTPQADGTTQYRLAHRTTGKESTVVTKTPLKSRPAPDSWLEAQNRKVNGEGGGYTPRLGAGLGGVDPHLLKVAAQDMLRSVKEGARRLDDLIMGLAESGDPVKVRLSQDLNERLKGIPDDQRGAEAARFLGAMSDDGEGGSGGPTSIKNRVVNEERGARGVWPLDEPMPREWAKFVVPEAVEAYKENPERPRELVRELLEKPRPHTDTEGGLLLIHRVNLRRSFDEASRAGVEAQARGDETAAAEAAARATMVENDLFDLESAAKMSGTETARGLAFRRAMMEQDYSLAAMEIRRRQENGYEPLTEAQKAETRALQTRLETAQKQIAEHQAKIVELEAARAADKIIIDAAKERPAPKPKPKAKAEEQGELLPVHKRSDYGSQNKIITKEKYEAARAALRERFGRTTVNAMIPVDLLKPLAEMGAFHMEAGLRKFGEWSRAMVDELGEGVRPYLEDAFKDAQEELHSSSRKDAKTALREGLSEGETIASMPRLVHKLALDIVRGGVTERNALIDALHTTLKEVAPDITRREVMEVLSGYGKVIPLDKDAAKAELREIKGQLLQVLKLDDMAAGKPPLATGREYPVPGEIQRMLIKEVNEAKKRGGYDTTDPAKALKSALDTIKTRLKNQITDLQRQIDSGVKDVPVKSASPTDPEVESLRAARDLLRETYDTIFGKPQMTDAQRIEIAERALDKSIASYEQRIAAGDLSSQKKPSKTPSTPELEAKRAYRDGLKATMDELRTMARPKATPEERALKSLKTRLTNQTADLYRRIATGDLVKQKKAPVVRDAEAIRLEAEYEMARKAWMEALTKDRLARRTLLQKTWDRALVEPLNLSRAILTSGDASALLRQGFVLGAAHPMLAAKALGPMLKALKSKRGQAEIEAEIRANRHYSLGRKAGMFLTDHGTGRAGMEEGYQSVVAPHLPIVAGTQRAYTTYLNKLRMDAFSYLVDRLSRTGTPTMEEAKAIATWINEATGRGGGAKMQGAMGVLNKVFFAPRLVLSRFQVLTGHSMWKGSDRTRKLIAWEYARFLGGVAMVYAIGGMFGAEVETNPRSTDFGKMRFGSVRVDPLAGLQQPIVLGTQVATGERKKTDGRVVPLRGKGSNSGNNAGTVMGRFLRSKLNPAAGGAWDLASGYDYSGKPTNLGDVALNMVVPLSYKDVIPMMEKHGVPKGTIYWLLSMLGMGVRDYRN